MPKWEKALSVAVNVAILVVAACFLFVFARNMMDRHRAPAGSPMPAKGDVVQLDGPSASDARTLLIGMQVQCHFCHDSLPFYQKLAADAAHSKTHLVFVFADPVDAARNYLAENHVPAQDVRSQNLGSLHIGGTPTVLLLDAQHHVQNFWIGKLPEKQEAEVEAELQ